MSLATFLLRAVQTLQLIVPGYRANQRQLMQDHGMDHRYLPLVPKRIELECSVSRREPWMDEAGAGRVAMLPCPNSPRDYLLIVGRHVVRLTVYRRGGWAPT